jgi:hypothetical protein
VLWQIWKAMVNIPKEDRYVGDASQPLHCPSIRIHGIPSMKQVEDPRSPFRAAARNSNVSKPAVQLRFTELTKKHCWN